MLRIAALCALLAALALPRLAEACSPPQCLGGFLLPKSGEVPANAPALYWLPRLGHSNNAPPPFILLRLDAQGDEEIPVSVEKEGSRSFVVRLQAPLQAGETYRATGDNGCNEATPRPTTVEFTAATAAPLPTTLGAMEAERTKVDEALHVAASGTCSALLRAATADVSLALSEEARPWANLLRYSTMVDGAGWHPSGSLPGEYPPGSSWVGRARDRLYAACDRDSAPTSTWPGLALGWHTVEMSASLPGTDIVLVSRPIEVELRCDGDASAPRVPGTDSSGEDFVPSAGCACGPETSALGIVLVPFILRRRERR